MKRILITTGLFLAITATVFGQTKNFIDQPYIEVAGSADTLVTPNQIYIKIIISEKDSKDKISVEEQENNMITSLKTLNINTEKDLTTSDMLSNYKSYFLKQKEILKTKDYILKVSDASTASKVFVELESIGISNTSIEKTEHSDFENIKNTCRTKAIVNANKKAIALTKPLSQSIGNAIFISDNETIKESSIDDALQGRIAGLDIVGYGAKRKIETPKIEFRKIKISATVTVKFVLK
jgi:uncharacterized protein YggE